MNARGGRGLPPRDTRAAAESDTAPGLAKLLRPAAAGPASGTLSPCPRTCIGHLGQRPVAAWSRAATVANSTVGVSARFSSPGRTAARAFTIAFAIVAETRVMESAGRNLP